MTAMQVIMLAINISMALIVFCLTLKTGTGDLVSLLRKPGLLIRSLLAMNIVMPIVAVLIAMTFSLSPVVKVALIALAISPVPPILPSTEIKSGASVSYSMGLLATSAIFALVSIPLMMALIGMVFGRTASVAPMAAFKAVGITLLAPLLAGAIVRELAPGFAARVARPISLAAHLLLLVALIPVVILAWPHLVAQVGNFTLLAITIVVLIGLLVGHLLGGPDPGDRTALALSTASRHPGVAVGVAMTVTPNDKSVVAAVLLAFLVGVIVTGLYGKWRRRSLSSRTA
jgi:bile acid:Na+ symporter, BASS family